MIASRSWRLNASAMAFKVSTLGTCSSFGVSRLAWGRMEVPAVAGLLGLLLVKEAGVPIPVPGDLIVVGTGAALAGEAAWAVVVLPLILVAGFIGGTVQFAAPSDG